MGIVIGETTEIGDDCLIYQNATLGGTGKEKGKRHPTLGNHVVIGAGAKVLGAITIGDHAKVGAGSVVVRSVPANTTVVGVPGRVVIARWERLTTGEGELEHGQLPDPEAQAIKCLGDKVRELEKKIEALGMEQKKESPKESPALCLIEDELPDGGGEVSYIYGEGI
jgi:serine O-acetyltransferase